MGWTSRASVRGRRRLIPLVCWLLAGSLHGAVRPAQAEPLRSPVAQRTKRVLTLPQCLELARENFPKVRQARARLKRKEAERDQAYSQPFSEFNMQAGLAIAPQVKGTTIYSPNSDSTLTPQMLPAYQFGVSGLVPLVTFGKLAALWQAAEQSVEIGKGDITKEQNAVQLEVRKAYYGVLFARDSLALLKDARGELRRAIEKLQEKLAKGEGDDVDLLKLSMTEAELDARGSEAVRGEELALVGLKFLTGQDGPVDVPDVPLNRLEHQLRPLPVYLEAARLHRPELNMVKAGLRARVAQVELERAKFFPDLGLALEARIVRSPGLTDQYNLFANDPGNYAYFGAGLGLRWKLDFASQASRLAQARADLEEMRATETFALGGVASEVEEAYQTASDAWRRLDAWHRAARFAKQWLIKVQQGSELGLTDDDELVEPAKEYALKRFSEMNAIYDYNVAMSRLAQATAWNGIFGDEGAAP